MPKPKKPVDPESLPYRPCVGVMVLNREGLVWTGHRIAQPDSEFAGTELLWQMPQGGIDKDEEPYPAALRELYEETGMRSVSLLAEAPQWIKYDLPENLARRRLQGANIAARRKNGSRCASPATSARLPSTRRPAATRPSSTTGRGSRWPNCPT